MLSISPRVAVFEEIVLLLSSLFIKRRFSRSKLLSECAYLQTQFAVLRLQSFYSFSQSIQLRSAIRLRNIRFFKCGLISIESAITLHYLSPFEFFHKSTFESGLPETAILTPSCGISYKPTPTWHGGATPLGL
jgi:hypothetical protein